MIRACPLEDDFKTQVSAKISPFLTWILLDGNRDYVIYALKIPV
jgi:hypothetical protein